MPPRSFAADESNLALARAIRAIRREREMTQNELARRSDIHPTYISHLESGRRNLTWTAMKKISEGLGVTAAELVRRTEELERAR